MSPCASPLPLTATSVDTAGWGETDPPPLRLFIENSPPHLHTTTVSFWVVINAREFVLRVCVCACLHTSYVLSTGTDTTVRTLFRGSKPASLLT